MALDWTRNHEDFRSAISTYTAAGGVDVPAESWVFGGWVSALGGWLVYNATHCADTDHGRHEIIRTVQRLAGLSTRLPGYLSALA